MMTSSERYKKANEFLKRRFGEPHSICQAWLSRITNGPPVKSNNGEVLREFADDVRGCLETHRAMGKLAN